MAVSGLVGVMWDLREPIREIAPDRPPEVVVAERDRQAEEISQEDLDQLEKLLVSHDSSNQSSESADAGSTRPPEVQPTPKPARKMPMGPTKLLRLDPKSSEGRAIVLQLLQSPTGVRILLRIPAIRAAVQDMLNSPSTLEEFRQFLNSEEMKKFRENLTKSENGSKAAEVLASDPLMQELMDRLDLKDE